MSKSSSSVANNDRSMMCRVRFSAEIEAQGVLRRIDYVEAEARATWILPDEKMKMFSRYEKTVERMMAGEKAKKSAPYRGLENFRQESSEAVRAIIHSCVDAVMDEQETQWQTDSFDWDRFAQLSRRFSKSCVKKAIKTAKSDEKEARKAYKTMENLEKEDEHEKEDEAVPECVSISSEGSSSSRSQEDESKAFTPPDRADVSKDNKEPRKKNSGRFAFPRSPLHQKMKLNLVGFSAVFVKN